MIIYPAIDLKDGQCVRLEQGEMERATVFSSHPANQAAEFEQQGFEWIHIVDLNGAFAGKPINHSAVESILDKVNIPIQLGGGIRNMASIERWLEAGIERVILGTAALNNPTLVTEACRQFPSQIAVGIDAKNGLVAVDGWANTSEIAVSELAEQMEDIGVAAIIYTDISRDGMLVGPDLEGTKKLAESVTIPVIASGGMSSLEDVESIKNLEADGVQGVIIGRALYDGRISPADALKVAA